MTGCQQVDELKKGAENTISDAAKQVESAKAQVIQTKEAVDQKANQIKEAADAVGKIGQ